MYQFELRNKFLGTRKLRYDPKGWDALKREFAREAKYKGITQTFTTDLEFVKDGKAYLEQAYDKEGIESVVDATIREFNSNEFKYEDLYEGRIGMPKYQTDGISVIADITQTTLSQQLLNQDDVEVNLLSRKALNGANLPEYPNTPTLVKLHSKEILKRFKGTANSPAIEQSYTFTTEPWVRSPSIVFGFNEVEVNELDMSNAMSGFIFSEIDAGGVPEILRAKELGEVHIKARVNARIRIGRENGDYDRTEVWYYFQINNNPPQQIAHVYNGNVGGAFNYTLSGDLNTTLNLNIGDKVYLYGKVQVSDVSGAYRLAYSIVMLDDSFLEIEFKTRTPETTCAGVLVHEAFSRICESIKGSSPAFYSEFFGRTDSFPLQYTQDGPGSLLMVTGGFQIRQFPLLYENQAGVDTDAKALTDNFADLFESMDALFCLGAGIETINGVEMIRVEPLSYFFKQEVSLDLGAVVNLKKSVASDYYYSTAEFGFQKWKTGQENSLGEVNTKQTDLLPLTQTKNKYSKLSKHIAGGFLIEEARRNPYNPEAEEGSDKDEDDSRFLVSLLRSNNGGFITERNQVMELANVYSPDTVYNPRLSPKRSMLRHGHILKAALLKQLDKSITFNYGEGNFKAGSKLPEETAYLFEDANIPAEDLPDPLWIPENYTFERPLTKQERAILRQKPYHRVAFLDTTATPARKEQGYLFTLSDDWAKDAAEFKLLRAYTA